MIKSKRVLVSILVSSIVTIPAIADSTPNAIDNAMFFKSQVKDSSECSMSVMDGKIVFADTITNPAISCPDAFAWKKFLETIKEEFWNWAYDSYTWPNDPFALCDNSTDSTYCCNPESNTNPGYDNADNPGEHCPYFPEDHISKNSSRHLVKANSPFKQKFSNFQTGHSTLITELDPGRVIRQEMAEVVFRNKPMWEYVFKNDLYNSNGLAKRFEDVSTSISNNAPYRNKHLEISFPVGSIMFKTDWLYEEEAKKLGLDQNKEHPYITMYMTSPVGDNDPGVFREGLHYLMAITAASKDLPNWHWYAIEHVDNLGRCDYTGCNDSYGYYSSDSVPEGYAKNFVKPLMKSDNLAQPSPIFLTGQKYPAEKINPQLNKIFEALGIGQGKVTKNSKVPSASDPAWYSYRLKGTQTEFVDNYGVVTGVGNSVTEGGFVNTSSCMTCHVQATVNETGTVAIGSVGFASDLNLIGYNQSSRGTPLTSWFYGPGSGSNTLMSLQTDFVWGILFSNELNTTVSKKKW